MFSGWFYQKKNELPKINNGILPGDIAFKLFDTYGFPLDLTQMILRDKKIAVDVNGFEKCMAEQKERSRADTRGTKLLWESQTDLPDTDDIEKYETKTDKTATVNSTAPKFEDKCPPFLETVSIISLRTSAQSCFFCSIVRFLISDGSFSRFKIPIFLYFCMC